MIKVGIAIGPRTWFGDRYLENVSYSGTTLRNHFQGAFGYAIAITSAHNFTVEGNDVFGNVSFIGSRDPNCTKHGVTPNPGMFVIDRNNTHNLSIQPDFTEISDGGSMTCLLPPNGDYWPFRGYGFNTGIGSSATQSLIYLLAIVSTCSFLSWVWYVIVMGCLRYRGWRQG